MNGLYIDIGTQTTLWMIGDTEDGIVFPQRRGYWTNSFGLSSNQIGEIPRFVLDEETKRIEQFIENSKIEFPDLKTNGLIVGTAALRNSRNGEDWLKKLHSVCGTDCKLLSPNEEALATWYGSHSRENDTLMGEELVVDLGGGSTEFIWLENNQIKSYSIETGASVLTKYFDRDPLSENAVVELNQLYSEQFNKLHSMIPKVHYPKLVGGTSVSFTSLLQGKIVDDPLGIENPLVQKEIFETFYKQLVTKSEFERQSISGIPIDRIKVLPSGATLLKLLIDFFSWNGFQVEPRGVLFGLPLLKQTHLF